MRQSNGIEFERETAAALRRLGWHVEHTPPTSDYGADLLATSAVEKMVVQCKDWKSPAPFSAVQEAHTARSYFGAELAVVVSRSGFTYQARQAARKLKVELVGLRDLDFGAGLDRTAEGSRFRLDEQTRLQEERRIRAEAVQERKRAARRAQDALRDARKQANLELESARLEGSWQRYDNEVESYERRLQRLRYRKYAAAALACLALAFGFVIAKTELGQLARQAAMWRTALTIGDILRASMIGFGLTLMIFLFSVLMLLAIWKDPVPPTPPKGVRPIRTAATSD